MRIALIQMPVLPDKVKNIQTACGKIRAPCGSMKLPNWSEWDQSPRKT